MAIRTRDWFTAFWRTDKSVWHRATSEVLTIGFISVLPLFLAGVAAYFQVAINSPGIDANFWTALWKPISSGQLLFYAISFVATVIFYASSDFKYASSDFKRAFPLRLIYIVVSILFCIFAALLIGIDPSLEKLDIPPIIWASIVVYVLSALLYWSIIVFKAVDPEDYADILREGEEATQRQLEALRASK